MPDYREEIKDYITKKGITQSFICNKTGISAPKLSMSLSGKRELSIEEYALICGALEVDTNCFVHPHLPNIRG